MSSRGQRGQATVEWTGLLLLVSIALAGLAAVGSRIDGWSFGGHLTHRFLCAVKRHCADGDRALARAYGDDLAALVRAHAPNLVYEPGERELPVDWRRCRRAGCANAPDAPGLDVHRSGVGERATAFTRVLRRGGRTFLQYWLYYPDSNSTWAGSDVAWAAAWLLPYPRGIVGAPSYPGRHRDDWETYHARIEPGGGVWVRASSHGHYQGCKDERCRNRWIGATGWTRVSRGSHAGHIPMRGETSAPVARTPPRLGMLPGAAPVRVPRFPLFPGLDLDERTTTAEGLRLIPLETHGRRRYRPLDDGVRPPWRKDVYRDPESDES